MLQTCTLGDVLRNGLREPSLICQLAYGTVALSKC